LKDAGEINDSCISNYFLNKDLFIKIQEESNFSVFNSLYEDSIPLFQQSIHTDSFSICYDASYWMKKNEIQKIGWQKQAKFLQEIYNQRESLIAPYLEKICWARISHNAQCSDINFSWDQIQTEEFKIKSQDFVKACVDSQTKFSLNEGLTQEKVINLEKILREFQTRWQLPASADYPMGRIISCLEYRQEVQVQYSICQKAYNTPANAKDLPPLNAPSTGTENSSTNTSGYIRSCTSRFIFCKEGEPGCIKFFQAIDSDNYRFEGCKTNEGEYQSLLDIYQSDCALEKLRSLN